MIFVLKTKQGSWYLNKHLTSIEKRLEETTAHAQNRTPERDDQEGAARDPEKQKELRRKTQEITLQYFGVKFKSHNALCGHLQHYSITDVSAGQGEERTRLVGRAALDIFLRQVELLSSVL
ncbi:hypothetical protein PBY51_006965 [Eleginops maclovinus]|uniref:Uncharacterized protein n=1 Tax=Eleginops maclovinus TaxID=56733 RepID=A0AAN7X589_ELEMC|nr:hypothetical protein PBY51_006965 [Eleginops maclovinus]